MLILNAYEIMSLWISGKYKEIFVKKLVGIKNSNIYFSLFFNYLCLIFISSLIGTALAVIISIPINSFISCYISVYSYFISLFINIITGCFFGLIIYFMKIKNKLLELK